MATSVRVWFYESPTWADIYPDIYLFISILYSSRGATRAKGDPVPCERLLSPARIRCASWAQTALRVIKTQWSSGAEHLNTDPQSLGVSDRSDRRPRSTFYCTALQNEGSPESRPSGGSTDAFKSERLVSVARVCSVCLSFQVFAVCWVSFRDKGGISSPSRQAVAAPTEPFTGFLIKHTIWPSINSPRLRNPPTCFSFSCISA